MKVLITGDRTWKQEYRKPLKEVFEELQEAREPIEIIVGDCPTGVDDAVRTAAGEAKIKCRVFAADWQTHGKAAGPIRNKQMVEQKPDLCIACHSDYQNSKGTKNCASQAIKAGITTVMIPRDAPFSLKDYQ